MTRRFQGNLVLLWVYAALLVMVVWTCIRHLLLQETYTVNSLRSMGINPDFQTTKQGARFGQNTPSRSFGRGDP